MHASALSWILLSPINRAIPYLILTVGISRKIANRISTTVVCINRKAGKWPVDLWLRIPIESENASGQSDQLTLFEDDRYKYRIFCTSLQRQAH